MDGQPCLSSLRRATAVGNAGDCDNDMVPLKPGAGARVCTCACVHPKHQKLPSVSERSPAVPVTHFRFPIKTTSVPQWILEGLKIDLFFSPSSFPSFFLSVLSFIKAFPHFWYSLLLTFFPLQIRVWWPVKTQQWLWWMS